MKFGSVNFFKRLILTVIFGWLGTATVLAVFFGIRYSLLLESTNKPNGIANDTAVTLSAGAGAYIPEGASVNEAVDILTANGYSADEISTYIDSEYNGFDIPPETSVQSEKASVQSETTLVTTAVETTSQDTIVSEPIDGAQELQTDDYTALYPELYCDKTADNLTADENTVFLTFDDGPSQNTYDILYILKKHNIKATFFMSAGKTDECTELMIAVAEAGHTIGVHSFSHDAEKIYASVEDYLTDFYETYKMIYDATGVKPQIFRFVGGSGSIPENVKSDIIAEMTRRGFVYYDSNAESGDRDTEKSWQHIYDCSFDSVCNNRSLGIPSILHLHDSADDYTTVITTEDIIIDLEREGFIFLPLKAGYIF